MAREGYKKCELGNDLKFTDDLMNEMMLVLVEEASDDFWRILKYAKTDILANPSAYPITTQDKYDMIKQNNVDTDGKELTRIKAQKFNDDISTEAHTEIRIFDGLWTIQSLNDYRISIGIEIISENSIIQLSGVSKRTINVLRHEIYRIFNNAYVEHNIGKMTNDGTRGSVVTFNKQYQGYQLSLSSSSG